jgi:putative transcriptional regulator
MSKAVSRAIANIAADLYESRIISDSDLDTLTARKEVRSAVRELHREGEISDAFAAKITARGRPERVPLPELTAPEIASVREITGVSQAVFADALNVSKVLVSKWERGERKPSGAALKLLTLVKARGLAAIES